MMTDKVAQGGGRERQRPGVGKGDTLHALVFRFVQYKL